MSLNVEGLTSDKEKIISHLAKENNVDVLCLQETHRKECDYNPSITNMKMVDVHTMSMAVQCLSETN